jgi:spore coat polysaccharide biosynthesis protein SpsF
MGFATDQEAFWAGEFGDEYIGRNNRADLLSSNVAMLARALRSAGKPRSCIEFGANIGLNLRALKILFPEQEQHAIEINADAVAILKRAIPVEQVMCASILEFTPARTWDLVLIKGVLIHQNPEALPIIYDTLVDACARWLLVCEYYNPVPVAVDYRGHKDRLFKRDFAGEIMDRHSCMELSDYGFVYRRDPVFPQDDSTWFLLEKRSQV